MKNVISYALGLLVLASAAQAAPRSPAQAAARMLPKTASAAADRKAVASARVKLMNDVRQLGPDSPQVQQDKEALISALEKLRGDSGGASRPVNVKRNPRKVARTHKAKKTKRTTIAKKRARRAPRKVADHKISHPRTRKHAPTRTV